MVRPGVCADSQWKVSELVGCQQVRVGMLRCRQNRREPRRSYKHHCSSISMILLLNMICYAAPHSIRQKHGHTLDKPRNTYNSTKSMVVSRQTTISVLQDTSADTSDDNHNSTTTVTTLDSTSNSTEAEKDDHEEHRRMPAGLSPLRKVTMEDPHGDHEKRVPNLADSDPRISCLHEDGVHSRDPSLIEVLDLDRDCNTTFENGVMDISALILWIPLASSILICGMCAIVNCWCCPPIEKLFNLAYCNDIKKKALMEARASEETRNSPKEVSSQRKSPPQYSRDSCQYHDMNDRSSSNIIPAAPCSPALVESRPVVRFNFESHIDQLSELSSNCPSSNDYIV